MLQRRKRRGFLDATVLFLNLGLFGGLCLTLALFRLVGERSWAVTTGLYLPLGLLGAPLLLLTPLAIVRRRYVELSIQLVSVVVLVFPIMGYRLGSALEPQAARVRLRVLTHNTLQLANPAALVEEVLRERADIVLFQESFYFNADWWKARVPELQWVVRGEFTLGSRYAVGEVALPQPEIVLGKKDWPRYVRYSISVGGRPVTIYNTHPPSPRLSMQGLARQLRAGEGVQGATRSIEENTASRLSTLHALSSDARKRAEPVIIAGDTNLPQGSWALHSLFSGFSDAFFSAGAGFGYTFPSRPLPWTRIDRIWGNGAVRFLNARVTGAAGSDHHGVIAELEF
jgi:vancomycin resistance protein VanJ